MLQQKQLEYGNRWSAISAYLPGRYAFEIYTYYLQLIRTAISFAFPSLSMDYLLPDLAEARTPSRIDGTVTSNLR